MPYDAFISYSHTADRSLAPALQRGLQRLGRAPYQSRGLHVFRDDTNLEVSPELWGPIATALAASDWCVVLCSPEAAASKWVNREVEHWLSIKPADHVLLVATAGEITWDADRDDFDPRSTAVPAALFGAFPSEPRTLALQWARDDAHPDLRNARFRAAVAELAAPIYGIPREQLESEDLRAQRHALRLARAAIVALSMLLVVAVIAGIVAFVQRGQAQRSARAANARALAAQSTNQLRDGHTGTALLLAAAAERMNDSAATRSALLSALVDEPSLEHVLATGADGVKAVAFSPDGTTLAAATTDDRVLFWNASSGALDPSEIKPANVTELGDIAFLDGGRLIAVEQFDNSKTPDNVGVWDTRTRTQLSHITVSQPWVVSAEGTALATVNSTGIEIRDARTGRVRQSFTATGSADPYGDGLALSPDGKVIAVAQVGPRTAAGTHVETIDALDVGVGTWFGGCDVNVGGDFNGNFAQPPSTPMVVGLAVDDDATIMRSAVSGGTRVVLGRCDVVAGVPQVRNITVPTTSDALVAAVNADQTTIATRGTFDGTVRLFDAATTRELPATMHAVRAFPGTFASAVFAPDGSRVVAADAAGGDLKVWRTGTTGSLLTSNIDSPRGSHVVAVAPGGDVLAIDTGDATRLVTRTTEVVRAAVAGPATAVSFSPGGRDAAILRSSTNSALSASAVVVHVRDGSHRDVRLAVGPCPDGVDAFALASGAKRAFVVCGSFSRVPSVVELDISGADARVVASAPLTKSGTDMQVAVSSDGRFAVAGGFVHFGSGFELFESARGQLRTRASQEEIWGLRSAAFAPDDRTFVTSFGNGRTQLWHIGANSVRSEELSGPGGPTYTGLAFNAEGTELMAGGCTSSGLWTVGPLTRLATLPSGSSCPGDVAFTADGRNVLTAAAPATTPNQPQDSTAFDVDAHSWVRRACALVQRDLTKTEWSAFLPNAAYRRTCPGANK